MKYFIAPFFIIFCGNICAQNVDLKIIDETSGEAVAFAEIIFSSTQKSVRADLDGELTITASEFPLGLEIQAPSFDRKTIEVREYTNYLLIALKPNVEKLSEVVIESTIIPKQIQKTPAAVNVLGIEDIERSSKLGVTEVLSRAPGVQVQQGALNTQKISIRGIGSRAQYGTNRVKAYLDGIPLTTVDGATTIEDLDLDAIEKIEVIKGPTSSIYGAGLGGVMNFYSATAPLNSTASGLKYLFGSFGLSKKTISASHSNNNNNFFVAYNQLKSDGFRENSAYNRKNLMINAKLFAENGNNFSLLAHYTKLKAYIPSSINEETFNEAPESAAYTWNAAKGYEAYEKILLGTAYNHYFSEYLSNTTSIFLTSKIADEPRPFDILKEERIAAGARTKFNYIRNLLEIPTKISLGAEYQKEWYNHSTFMNLYEDFPEQGSVLGEILSNNRQQRDYLNLFAQINLSLSENFEVEAGMNLNITNYHLTDLFVQDEVNQTGAYSFETILSPRVGITYDFSEEKTVYASISHGFSTPNVEETFTPEGLINTNIQSETGINYEIGLKANWFQNKLYTEIAAYYIQVANLLVAQRVAEDQYVGVNAGKTSHRGIEFLVDYSLALNSGITLKPYAAVSFNFHKFDEFIDEDNNYSGNELTGVPTNSMNLGLDFSTDFGLSLYGTFNYVGAIPLNDENSLYTAAYNTLNLKLKQQIRINSEVEMEFVTGLNNVFNTNYAASILTNAVGFGGAEPRYYYPGDPQNYFAGVSLKYVF